MIDTIPSLIAFLRQFHRHWLTDPALDPSRIPPDLPDGLAAIYRELGALVEIEAGPDNSGRAPFAAQDGLVALSRLKRVGGMAEFAWENQGNWSARCPLRDPEPPVYSNAADAWEIERRGFVVVCASLTHFLTALCLQEAVMSCRNLAAVGTDGGPAGAVVGELRPLWLHGQYVYGGPSHSFFVSLDQEVLVMDHAGLWVGSPVRPVGNLMARGVHCQLLHGA
jgi:hypothetical protein